MFESYYGVRYLNVYFSPVCPLLEASRRNHRILINGIVSEVTCKEDEDEEEEELELEGTLPPSLPPRVEQWLRLRYADELIDCERSER